MKFIIDTYKHFKNKTTYIISIKDVETIVEYKGKDDNDNRIFTCQDIFADRLDNIKVKPSEDFVFLYRSNNLLKTIVTIPFTKISIVYPEDEENTEKEIV